MIAFAPDREVQVGGWRKNRQSPKHLILEENSQLSTDLFIPSVHNIFWAIVLRASEGERLL
jgi:hypothetical protein